MERYVLLDTMRQYPMELKNYPEAQDDEEIVRLAVKKSGYALGYASQRLQNDYETVMTAVKKIGTSLKYASDELRRNPEIIAAAIHSDGRALEFVPEDLQQNRQLVLEAAKNGCNWSLIPKEFQRDKEIVLQVIAHYEDVYPEVPDEIADDMDIILAAIEGHPNSWPVELYLSDAILGDKEKMLKIVSIKSTALAYASEEVKKDKDVALAALDHAIKEYTESWGWEHGFGPFIPDFAVELRKDPDIKAKMDPYLYTDYRFEIPWEIQCHIEAGNIDCASFESMVEATLKRQGITFEAIRVLDDETAEIIQLDLCEIDEDEHCPAVDDEHFLESWIEELNEKYGLPYEEDED